MEIKAKGQFDKETIRALTHLTIFKKANPKKRLTLWTIIFVVLVAISILEIAFFGMDLVLLVLLLVETFWFFIVYFLYFITPKMQYKSLSKMQNAENVYVFCENVLKAYTKTKEYNGEAEIEYSLFVKVYETTKYLFLFQTNNQVFIINKSTIQDGSIEEIRNKISYFVKDKYVICRY